MKFDKNDLIIQDEGSGEPYGDTCNRTGHFYSLFYVWSQILKKDLSGTPFDRPLPSVRGAYIKITVAGNLFVRHPDVSPWNNPLNVTRDQSNPMLGALALWNCDRELWQQLKNFIKRCFFYQSFERDFPGTTKYLWPVYYRKDERFDDITIVDRDRWIWKPDFADPMLPHDLNYFLRSFRSAVLYPAVLFGDLFLLAETFLYILKCKRDETYCDDMQLINRFIVAKILSPTFLSDLSTWLFCKYRPGGPMAGIEVYFTKGFDSPDWIPLWRPVIEWLK